GGVGGDLAQGRGGRVRIGGETRCGGHGGEVGRPLSVPPARRHHAEVAEQHGAEQNEGDRADRGDRDLAALAHGSAARATALVWASPPARRTGTVTTSVWARTWIVVSWRSSAGTGRPSATTTAAWSAIPWARPCAAQATSTAWTPTATIAARAAKTTSSMVAWPRSLTSAPRPPRPQRRHRIRAAPPGSARAPSPRRRPGRRPRQRRPSRRPRGALCRHQRPPCQGCLPHREGDGDEHRQQDDGLDAGLAALPVGGSFHALQGRARACHGTTPVALQECQESPATIEAG